MEYYIDPSDSSSSESDHKNTEDEMSHHLPNNNEIKYIPRKSKNQTYIGNYDGNKNKILNVQGQS